MFAIYQILLSWGNILLLSWNRRTPQPKANPTQDEIPGRLKVAFGTLLLTASSFSWGGIDFMSETDYKKPNPTKFCSVLSLIFFLILRRIGPLVRRQTCKRKKKERISVCSLGARRLFGKMYEIYTPFSVRQKKWPKDVSLQEGRHGCLNTRFIPRHTVTVILCTVSEKVDTVNGTEFAE